MGCAPCYCSADIAGYSVALSFLWLTLPLALTCLMVPLFSVYDEGQQGPNHFLTFSAFGLCGGPQGCYDLSYDLIVDVLPIDLFNALRASIVAVLPLSLVCAALMSARLGKQQRRLPISPHLLAYIHVTAACTVIAAVTALVCLCLCLQVGVFLHPERLHAPLPFQWVHPVSFADAGAICLLTAASLAMGGWVIYAVTACMHARALRRAELKAKAGALNGEAAEGHFLARYDGGVEGQVEGGGYRSEREGVVVDALPPYTPRDASYAVPASGPHDTADGPVLHLSSPPHEAREEREEGRDVMGGDMAGILPSFSSAVPSMPPPSPLPAVVKPGREATGKSPRRR